MEQPQQQSSAGGAESVSGQPTAAPAPTSRSFGRKLAVRGGLAVVGSVLCWLYYEHSYARRLQGYRVSVEAAQQDSSLLQSLGDEVPYSWWDVRGAVLALQWRPAALPWRLLDPQLARCHEGESRAVVWWRVRGALTAATVTATAVQRTDGRAAWTLQNLTVVTDDGRREVVLDRTPLLPNHV